MTDYIDGFVFPIKRSSLSDYKSLAEAVAIIWKEHGALDYREYVGDDMALDGTRSFPNVIEAKEDEVIVFGWVSFESRKARDVANEKVAADPRVTKLVETSTAGFDSARMIYGGFKPLVQSLIESDV